MLKSDAQSYEAMRAMFEAFRVNIPKTTGIIQWMLNSAWPSMYWQLYDYYLKPTAAYYAARNANQPVQLIYNYGDNSIYAVNETNQDVKDLAAEVKVMDVNSNLLSVKEEKISVQLNSSVKIMLPGSYKGTVFIDLKLKDANGNRIAGNFYWLSDKPDELAWDKTTWAYTPMKSYTDFTSLGKMPTSNIQISYKLKEKDKDILIITHLSNPTDKIAFLNTLNITDENGKIISPVFWDDNYFSLLPGEKRDLTCSLSKTTFKGTKPDITLSGWNIVSQRVSLK
jgi:exo-1,4-beta-D-glucosaminidase